MRRKCKRHLQTALNDLRPFSFFVPKFFLRYFQFRMSHKRDGGVSGTYKLPLLVYDHFRFFRPKCFCDISNSEVRTGETEVSVAFTSCSERFATIFVFCSKIFFAISQILKFAKPLTPPSRRCQRHLQAALNGLRPFSFFRTKFFFAISQILKFTQARRRCQRHLQAALNGLRPFSFFCSNIFFCDISNSEVRTGETEVSAAPTSCPERFATIFFFRPKFFFAISQILKYAQARRRCQRHLQAALNGLRPFLFFRPKFFFAISQILKFAQARLRCQRNLQAFF